MSHTFKRSVFTSIITLLLLGGVAVLADYAPRQKTGPGRFVIRAIRTLDERELNREAREQQMKGYYEVLLDTGAEGGSWLELRRPVGRKTRQTPRARVIDQRVSLKTFLHYELPANLDVKGPDPRFNLTTNRFGMADRDYDVQKPRGIHRIALIGDSIAFGYGTPPGTSFPAVLEERVNERLQRGGIERVEILNFAVSGYRATQMLEVGLEKAPRFQPDTYMMTITPLSLVKDWGHHIVELLQKGIDLKYEPLRRAVADAEIRRDDKPEIMHAKLARHRLPILRWVVAELKAHAQRNGASFAVVLVPSVHGNDIIDEHFDGVHDILEQLDVTVIDLLDTFRGGDLPRLRVDEGDNHPSQEGHRLLAEAIVRQVEKNPLLKDALLGSATLTGAAGR